MVFLCVILTTCFYIADLLYMIYIYMVYHIYIYSDPDYRVYTYHILLLIVHIYIYILYIYTWSSIIVYYLYYRHHNIIYISSCIIVWIDPCLSCFCHSPYTTKQMGGVVCVLCDLLCRSGCDASVVASALAFHPPETYYDLKLDDLSQTYVLRLAKELPRPEEDFKGQIVVTKLQTSTQTTVPVICLKCNANSQCIKTNIHVSA